MTHVILLAALAAPPQLDRPTRLKLEQTTRDLADAQRRGDEDAVRRAAALAAELLGDRAGGPEVPDEYAAAPDGVPPLTAAEAREAFAPYLRGLPRFKWWRPGLDPAKTEHLPREAADFLSGAVAAARAKLAGHEQALAEARGAGDYLLWTQAQAGTGVIPFPAYRNGRGAAFEAAERFLRRAERDGKLGEVVKDGWAVDDLGDGGLQFDNGLCGCALFDLYELTKDEKYLAGARRVADWAAGRVPVPNWNYNSFSVQLLATAYRVTGEGKYLDAARRKARLGVYPGQLTAGPHKGRWADGHNARPAYHYIMARAVAVLVAALPADDADRPRAVECLRLALAARNADILARGVPTKDAALEALVVASRLPAEVTRDCRVAEALAAVERLVAAEFRRGKLPVAPRAWAALLEARSGGGK